jgi:hypothetical protein
MRAVSDTRGELTCVEASAALGVPQVYAVLMDEGEYLCSMRSMYRILDDEGGGNDEANATFTRLATHCSAVTPSDVPTTRSRLAVAEADSMLDSMACLRISRRVRWTSRRTMKVDRPTE